MFEMKTGNFVGTKMKRRIKRGMVWVLKVAVRWCVYDVVRSLCFSRGDVGWLLMTE